MKWEKSWAFITGASSGIGAATARSLAELGINLLIAGRREDRLLALKAELTGVEVEVLNFDIRDGRIWDEISRDYSALLGKVQILINNAGLAVGTEPVQAAKWSDWKNMLDTNVEALFRITHSLLPQMIRHGRGHIINLGSVAGRWTYPGGAVYCATKAAVRAFSEGLRMDTMGTGLRVTNIVPGMVETEFSEVRLGDSAKAAKVYEGMRPLAATDIAEAIVWSLTQPAHVNIQELVIFPTDQAGVGLVHRK